MTPHQGNTILFCSYQQLPCLCLEPMKDFLSWHGTLQGPSICLVHCFRNYRDTRTPTRPVPTCPGGNHWWRGTAGCWSGTFQGGVRVRSEAAEVVTNQILGGGLAVIGLTYLLESGWLDLCWNRVDSKDFVGIGLTLLELGWLPLLESGWLCWNWVDWAWSIFESTRFQQKRVKFVGIGLTQPLST